MDEHQKISQLLADDSTKLLESAIIANLELTPEERIEAHENARQLAMDLQEAGRALRELVKGVRWGLSKSSKPLR